MCDGYKNSVKTQNLHYIQISLYRGKITKQPKGDGKADISYKFANCFCVKKGADKNSKIENKKRITIRMERMQFCVVGEEVMI